MRVDSAVDGLPPKKDGANSMWRKGSELARLKALRLGAAEAMSGSKPCSSRVELRLVLHCDKQEGDLDSFVAGICDGLMAAHPLTPIDDSSWSDLPVAARPSEAIAFQDDAIVERIDAERRPMSGRKQWYEVWIIGE